MQADIRPQSMVKKNAVIRGMTAKKETDSSPAAQNDSKLSDLCVILSVAKNPLIRYIFTT